MVIRLCVLILATSSLCLSCPRTYETTIIVPTHKKLEYEIQRPVDSILPFTKVDVKDDVILASDKKGMYFLARIFILFCQMHSFFVA